MPDAFLELLLMLGPEELAIVWRLPWPACRAAGVALGARSATAPWRRRRNSAPSPCTFTWTGRVRRHRERDDAAEIAGNELRMCAVMLRARDALVLLLCLRLLALLVADGFASLC